MLTNTQITKVLDAFRTTMNTHIGVMYDCAMDNAGFDGQNPDHLTPEDRREIVRHIASIIDGQMLDYATAEEYAQAEKMLKQD